MMVSCSNYIAPHCHTPSTLSILSLSHHTIPYHTSSTNFTRTRMATIAGLTLSTPRVLAKATDTPKSQTLVKLNQPWRKTCQLGSGRIRIRPVRAAPEGISERVEKSIKDAEEKCSDNATSGECAAAWDEVEELSAAASHAKDRKKGSDPLEEYCKDNPETEECRTYED